ncbi:transposase [Erysipelothrix urinaevulpis]|uniref:transposase n=1 Tax=Erysipelothrix urinaevulpis TaxID=2683717 RepID=UPI0022A73BE3|nr:transposase [Erysipelothrix urinaevulpis]
MRICGDRNSYSKTDHDATFMHGKEDYYSKTGIFKPYYNLQIGVSDEYILHLGVYPNPTDTKTFIPFLETYFERYKSNPKYPVADAGYGSYDNYLYCLDHDMGLFMKYGHFNKENESKFKRKIYNVKNMDITPNKITAIDGTTYTYSHDYIQRRGLYPQHKKVYNHDNWDESMKERKIPKTISYDSVMVQLQNQARKNLKSPNGIELRKQRSIQVEGAFGDIKANTDYVRIQRRGKRSVQTELTLVALGYNLRKFHAKKLRKMN